MISQLQLYGVGMEVILVLQIWLIVFAHIVIHQGDRHNEGNKELPIEVKNLQQFSFFIPG
jgi:hypothetical protein